MARPKRQPPSYAEPADIERVADQWTDQQLECRDLGHHWEPQDVVHVSRLRFYRITHVCQRCDMLRIREMSEYGHVYAQTYRYPDGYLAEGIGRIAGDAKDAVRLASVRRFTDLVEVKGKAKEVDLPRFAKTREALGG